MKQVMMGLCLLSSVSASAMDCVTAETKMSELDRVWVQASSQEQITEDEARTISLAVAGIESLVSKGFLTCAAYEKNADAVAATLNTLIHQ